MSISGAPARYASAMPSPVTPYAAPVLVSQVAAAFGRLLRVRRRAVLLAYGGVDSPLAGPRVGPQGMDFRDQRDITSPFLRGQGRSHPGDSRAHDQDRVVRHRSPLALGCVRVAAGC